MGWIVAVLLTATSTSGCTAWVLCALLFLWSNFAEAKRVGMEIPQRLFASASVPGSLSPKITWRLAKNRSPHAIELAGLKSIYSQIPNVIEFKN